MIERVCECVCVCERERERERGEINMQREREEIQYGSRRTIRYFAMSLLKERKGKHINSNSLYCKLKPNQPKCDPEVAKPYTVSHYYTESDPEVA